MPAYAVMAEAGLEPAVSRREALTARLLANALALPAEDPLRVVADANPSPRLKSTVDWRSVGRSVWATAGIAGPIEPTLAHHAPPWLGEESMIFDLSVGALPVGAPPGTRKRAAE